MTILDRQKKYSEIIRYLATPVGKKKSGKPIFPSYQEASNLFGYHATQIFRIKKELLGTDEANPERKLPE